MTKLKAAGAAAKAKSDDLPTPPSQATPAPVKPKGWVLETPPDAPGETHDRFMARIAADGVVGNARSLVAFARGTFGEMSLTECVMALRDTARKSNDGDLTAAVSMLSSQAVALNAMFGELAQRSLLNLTHHIEASDRYMRLALKAQSQCRTTLETLAAIKNPPLVFARQANINNGGQQQVNNGTGPPPAGVSPPAPAGARAGETANRPNELLEAPAHGRP